jgi:hypothetical protein
MWQKMNLWRKESKRFRTLSMQEPGRPKNTSLSYQDWSSNQSRHPFKSTPREFCLKSSQSWTPQRPPPCPKMGQRFNLLTPTPNFLKRTQVRGNKTTQNQKLWSAPRADSSRSLSFRKDPTPNVKSKPLTESWDTPSRASNLEELQNYYQNYQLKRSHIVNDFDYVK